jgi:hypothetical protein
MTYEVAFTLEPVLRGSITVDADSEDEARRAISALSPHELIARCPILDVATLRFDDFRRIR